MPSWRSVWDGWMKVRPDVGVLHEALCERDAGFLGVADGGGRARLGHGDHDVGVEAVFAGQLAAHFHAGFVDGAAGDGRIRTGQVDVFEHAAGRGRRREALGAHAVLVDGDELAGLDVADEGGADGGQGGALGGHHPTAVEPAQDQRADAVRVAGGVQGALGHEDEGEGAVDLRQQLQGRLLQGAALLALEQGGDQRRVGGVSLGHFAGGGNAVAGDDHVIELGRVGQVAVVRQRHGPGAGGAEGGLGVGPV